MFKRDRFLTLLWSLLVYSFPLMLVAQDVTDPGQKPLPSVEELLDGIKDNLRSDRYLLRNYTYNETQEIVELNKKGEPKDTDVTVYEVFPSVTEELTYRRKVSKNGKPVDEKDLRKQDQKYQKRVDKYAARARKRGATDGSAVEAGEDELIRKEARAVEEVFRLFEFSIQGREQIDGHDTLVVDFAPRPDFKVKVKEVKQLKKIKGRAWITEEDYQLVRIEAETLKTLSFGWGIIAKLNKGANLVFQRRKVNDELWLPAEATFYGSGRLLLFKGFRFRARNQYSDYKKFSVTSDVTFPSGEEDP